MLLSTKSGQGAEIERFKAQGRATVLKSESDHYK